MIHFGPHRGGEGRSAGQFVKTSIVKPARFVGLVEPRDESGECQSLSTRNIAFFAGLEQRQIALLRIEPGFRPLGTEFDPRMSQVLSRPEVRSHPLTMTSMTTWNFPQ